MLYHNSKIHYNNVTVTTNTFGYGAIAQYNNDKRWKLIYANSNSIYIAIPYYKNNTSHIMLIRDNSNYEIPEEGSIFECECIWLYISN